jgi:uncharacterized protein (DUF1330 family)
MSAYLVAHVTVEDPEQWQVYVDSVGATLAPFGAEVIFRGRRTAVLVGEHQHDAVAVLQFPDETALNNWFNSEAYQQLAPTRDRAADVVFIGYTA